MSSERVYCYILQVVGLGRAYTDYTQKIVWYLEVLTGVNTTLKMKDEDLVVLIDAYDVLLFPAARKLSQVSSCAGHVEETAKLSFRFRQSKTFRPLSFFVPKMEFTQVM